MSAVHSPSRPDVETLVREVLYRQLGRSSGAAGPTLRVNSSARHMHISPENLAVLFGKGAEFYPAVRMPEEVWLQFPQRI